ncbi:MAG: DUF4886 domain-containing protein [Oscillospiraceae bacterium]|nr:DUF4886 domain-containing protein [Oscillospiraceae bacterium]
MKPIHVLSIGNSFSQDAHYYLHDFAKSEGVDIETVNLFIGGCSLERHYRNMVGNKREYTIEINGHRADGFLCSIDEALTAREWDFITLQQASPLSYRIDSYEPYLNRLAEHIRYMCPKAKLLIHQTWAYETGSDRIKAHGFETHDEMFLRVKATYEEAAKMAQADGIIPSGEAFQRAYQAGLLELHRDTFHASYGAGRFLLAVVWYACLTGNYRMGNRRYNLPIDEHQLKEIYKVCYELRQK